MSAPSSPLHQEGEDLLQAALSDAFSVSDLPRVPTTAPAPSAPNPQPEPATAPPPHSASALEHAAWQAEYDAQLAEWRRQNADARARAEAERARWEARRAAEREAGSESGWTSVSGPPHQTPSASISSLPAVPGSPSPADVRDLVAGEPQGPPHAPAPSTAEPEPEPAAATTVTTGTQTAAPSAHAQERSQTSSSPHWEDVPSSLNSSYPSLSFPDTSLPHSPSASGPSHPSLHPHLHHTHPHGSSHAHDSRAHGEPAPSTTLAIFDDSLSPRTRMWALVSSLGINLVLPFVNGVMLGFGEIFAKTVIVGWLGWRVPGNIGLGVPPPVRKERK